MSVDEPISQADLMFAALRTLAVHWPRGTNYKNLYIGCLECNELGCRQLDWAIEQYIEVFTSLESKRRH